MGNRCFFQEIHAEVVIIKYLLDSMARGKKKPGHAARLLDERLKLIMQLPCGYVLGLKALGAFGDFKLHEVTFFQRLEALALDC
jgi:hypothetical protein